MKEEERALQVRQIINAWDVVYIDAMEKKSFSYLGFYLFIKKCVG